MKVKTPLIHVSTLGQFEYCPNAGIIAYCRQGETETDDERIPNLGYIPPLDHALHLELFEELGDKLKNKAIAILILFLFVLLISKGGSFLLSFLLLLMMAPLVKLTVNELIAFYQTWTKLCDYERTPTIVLPEIGNSEVPVHWWSLVKSNYTPIMPKESFVDYQESLCGRPWRLLEHRDSRRLLPVIKRVGKDTELIVRSSHRVRMAAYAILLEQNGNVVADWGILIDSKTLEGFAVPILQTDRQRALTLVDRIQNIIISSNGTYAMREPPSKACRSCWLGKPRRYNPEKSATEFRGQELPAFLGNKQYFGEKICIGPRTESPDLSDKEQERQDRHSREVVKYYRRVRVLHSDCGDIFHWRPPHAAWNYERNA